MTIKFRIRHATVKRREKSRSNWVDWFAFACIEFFLELPIVIHSLDGVQESSASTFLQELDQTTCRRTWDPATTSGRKNIISLDSYTCHQRDVDNKVILSLQTRSGWMLNSRGGSFIDELFFFRHESTSESRASITGLDVLTRRCRLFVCWGRGCDIGRSLYIIQKLHGVVQISWSYSFHCRLHIRSRELKKSVGI